MRCIECNSIMTKNGIMWSCLKCIEALKRNNLKPIKLERSYLGIGRSKTVRSKVVIG